MAQRPADAKARQSTGMGSPETLACAACQRPLNPARQICFRFESPAGRVVKCLAHALRHGPLVRRAALTALVVGTILTLINQGDFILAGRFGVVSLPKMALTYLVPYGVATWGALSVSRVRRLAA